MARGNGEGTIYKRKDGRWCGQLTIGTTAEGKQKRKSFYGDTRKEVARKMTEMKHKIFTGTYIEQTNMKLEDWLKQWVKGRKTALAYSTYRNYEMMIRNHLIPTLGKTKLKELSARQVQDLLNHKLEHGKVNGEGGLSASTVKYIYTTLHAALEQAVKERMIPNNICVAVEVPKKQAEHKLHTWNNKQVNKFLNHAKSFKFYEVFFLALNTGMRKGELLGLQWKDIDFNKNKIEVKRQLTRTDEGLIFKKVKTKSGNRTIPITDDVAKFLRSHKIKQSEHKLALGAGYYQNDLIACNGIGNALDGRNLNREFKKVIKEAGLPEIRFHDLRHTFSTTYLQNGGNIKTLQQILGHSSITVTIDTYSHVTDEMLYEASKNISTMYKASNNA